jgi:hypothetical protein
MSHHLDRILVSVGHQDDPRSVLAAWLRAGTRAGLPAEKEYDANYGSVTVTFAPGVSVHLYAAREKVCERISTGFTTITTPAIPATSATPEKTEQVETFDWVCAPLTAPAEASA